MVASYRRKRGLRGWLKRLPSWGRSESGGDLREGGLFAPGGNSDRSRGAREIQWGAAWSGAHGYTDGRQRLCTPAERDVGFPYQAGLLTAEQTADLHARFSWAAYLLAKAATGRSYLDWVDRGRRPPTHAEFAAYIGWVIERADIDGSFAR